MTNLSDLSTAMADAVELAARSVVTVRAARPVSGTVVGDGLVLTPAHLLHADEVPVVTPDRQTLTGVVVGRDPGSDLALLRVDGLNVPPLTTGEAGRAGELLLAVGRPPGGVQASLGLNPGRARDGWLHAGAQPFPGVSGGALVNAQGELVGVLNAGVRRGQLLAVPAARAARVADLLSREGRVPRGYLGLATQPVLFPAAATPDEVDEDAFPGGPFARGPFGGGPWGDRFRGEGAPWGGRRGPGRGPDHGGHGRPRGPWAREGRPERGGQDRGGMDEARLEKLRRFRERFAGGRVGLTVVQVEAGSPGQAAGFRVGDVLLALDGEGFTHPAELLSRIRSRAGETVTLRVLRGGEEQDMSVTVGER
ncbi:S1C family serine protease [Deinococcus grandis]|nr:trypsin-like peptidase domain-containing protein [Deinococcus grandis]